MAFAGGGGWGAMTTDASRFKKVIEIENSCIVICYIHLLIIDGKHLSIKKVVENLWN